MTLGIKVTITKLTRIDREKSRAEDRINDTDKYTNRKDGNERGNRG